MRLQNKWETYIKLADAIIGLKNALKLNKNSFCVIEWYFLALKFQSQYET
jgi:hypothetical protein